MFSIALVEAILVGVAKFRGLEEQGQRNLVKGMPKEHAQQIEADSMDVRALAAAVAPHDDAVYSAIPACTHGNTLDREQ